MFDQVANVSSATTKGDPIYLPLSQRQELSDLPFAKRRA